MPPVHSTWRACPVSGSSQMRCSPSAFASLSEGPSRSGGSRSTDDGFLIGRMRPDRIATRSSEPEGETEPPAGGVGGGRQDDGAVVEHLPERHALGITGHQDDGHAEGRERLEAERGG